MQPTMAHQAMGYDRASTVFSPDGRLLQVEYAKKTVKQGTSALGIVFKDGVLILADKRVLDKLVVAKSIEKVFQIDDHIGATASGILSDARILIQRAQLLAQQHRVTYDEPMGIPSLVKDICDLKQAFTQYGGARPFGVSLLIAGVEDKKPMLFVTDPTGIFFEFRATAIGESEDELKEILSKRYKENMSFNDALKLAITSLEKVLGKQFNPERLDGACINATTGKFQRLSKDLIKKTKW